MAAQLCETQLTVRHLLPMKQHAPTETGFQSRAQLWKAPSGHDLK